MSAQHHNLFNFLVEKLFQNWKLFPYGSGFFFNQISSCATHQNKWRSFKRIKRTHWSGLETQILTQLKMCGLFVSSDWTERPQNPPRMFKSGCFHAKFVSKLYLKCKCKWIHKGSLKTFRTLIFYLYLYFILYFYLYISIFFLYAFFFFS